MPSLPSALGSTALCLAIALPAAAADTSYDFTVCTHGRRTVIEASADLVALGSEMFDGKAAEPGTAQGCRRDWGRYSAPAAK
ncbi:hypothetical protein [Piscinibacter gummiphilus]|uniref:Uncharacterized protein n=1 Tax=Piscinibacter gummiphilus TaxID=946333 RepID=A0ABZ0D0D3_9BURK|nr:hypothetical protein [Piscinibacter gummiphilus]WOB10637.1 hypothetical protein RXV79_11390 [Piscinibacter gummiphilus]